jgi:hypothetical protein
MNTTEINGSAWPIKNYVIVSVPLTVVTLLVPLFALQTFNFLVRIFQTSSRVRSVAKWGWISAAFIFELLADMLPVARPFFGGISLFILTLATTVYTVGLINSAKRHLGKGFIHEEFWRALYLDCQLWPLFCIVVLTLWFFFEFVELSPFIIYFFILGCRGVYRWWRRKRT